ncbi:MAG: peptidoglycan-binding protein [Clostridia bacterium]|nr:peptidoglycan-binding protein [Clostridia bacterium]
METIRKGSRGDAVRLLQEILNTLGYECGKTDGIFGKNTLSAVKKYQADNGLEADGIAGPLTWGSTARRGDGGQTGLAAGPAPGLQAVRSPLGGEDVLFPRGQNADDEVFRLRAHRHGGRCGGAGRRLGHSARTCGQGAGLGRPNPFERDRLVVFQTRFAGVSLRQIP